MSSEPQTSQNIKKIHIVICDDDIDDHFLLKSALKSTQLNCEIISVYNGLQLMDLLLRRRAYKEIPSPKSDIIFLDLNMPLLNGFGVLKEMKDNYELNNIPVYVLSTSSLADDKRKAIFLGAVNYITKPTDFQEFKTIVKNICNKHFPWI
ncbi:MAG: response regulator [Bacteroidia bacterium]